MVASAATEEPSVFTFTKPGSVAETRSATAVKQEYEQMMAKIDALIATSEPTGTAALNDSNPSAESAPGGSFDIVVGGNCFGGVSTAFSPRRRVSEKLVLTDVLSNGDETDQNAPKPVLTTELPPSRAVGAATKQLAPIVDKRRPRVSRPTTPPVQ